MTSILSVKLTVEVLQGVTVLKSTILMKSYSKISLIKANLEKLEKKIFTNLVLPEHVTQNLHS